MSGDNKRKILTLEERVNVLKKIDSGLSLRETARQFGCGRTQIQRIRSERSLILSEWEAGGRADLKYVKKRKATYEDINEAVWTWFCAARGKNLPVSGKLIQEKALVLSLEMGHDDFSASNGWLEAWRKRYNISFAALCGESAGVPQASIDQWTERLSDLMAGYDAKDIFNADETGLFYRALPTKSMVVKGDSCKGTKTAKDRMTVLLACSAAGEKLKPLVIGRAENPRCFKGIDKASLPVMYRANRKAWMTASLFREWVERLNSKMRVQGRHILLIIDNCGAHPHLQFSNVTIKFLPPNTTSKLQPCDAGIIATVKAFYRKRLLRHVLAEMDEASSAQELARSVTLRDAIRWLDLSWTELSSHTIVKCFSQCGLVPTTAHQEDACQSPNIAIPPPDEFSELQSGVEWMEFVNMDHTLVTTGTREEEQEEEDVQEEEEESEGCTSISTSQALGYSKALLGYADKAGLPEFTDLVHRVNAIVQGIRIKEKMDMKQKKISDFFKS